jgi:hypothetical protein
MARKSHSSTAVLEDPAPDQALPPDPPPDLAIEHPIVNEDSIFGDGPFPPAEPPAEPQQLAVTQASFASPKAGDLGTHLRNPLMIGNPGEAGVVLLAKRGYFAASIGTFSGVLVKFPPTSVLLKIYVTILTPFNGVTPVLAFGKTPTGSEFGGPVDLTQTQRTIEIPITALVYPTYSLYMNATIGTATVGECIITMVYSGTPLKTWQ